MASRPPTSLESPRRGATDAPERQDPTEAEIAAFGQWYELQPAEWVEFLDDLGKNGSSKHRAR